MKSPTIEKLIKDLENLSIPDFVLSIRCLLQSRTPIIYLIGKDEYRIYEIIDLICRTKGYEFFVWDCENGMRNSFLTEIKETRESQDAIIALDLILEKSKCYNRPNKIKERIQEGCNGIVYWMKDATKYMDTPIFERKLREIYDKPSIISVIITSPTLENIPIKSITPIVEMPPMSQCEYDKSFDGFINSVKNSIIGSTLLENWVMKLNENRKEIIECSKPLTSGQFVSLLSYSFIESINTQSEFNINNIKKNIEFFNASNK